MQGPFAAAPAPTPAAASLEPLNVIPLVYTGPGGPNGTASVAAGTTFTPVDGAASASAGSSDSPPASEG